MKVVFEINTLDDLRALAVQILSDCKDSRIFTLTGNLGAGKTTFVKYFCKALGCNPDDICSPTFSIVNEYISDQGSVYHMDLYRIKDLEEALDFGIEEYLFSGSYCFIEWPEIALQILDIPYYAVNMNVQSSGTRRVEINFHPQQEF